MINIAFCDDELSMLNEIGILLEQYRMKRKQDIRYTAFHSPFDLLAEIERGARYDALFLDVIMPGENGIEAASEIRKYDSNVKIIFLTSSSEYAVQSYKVSAFFYLLKPIYKEEFWELLDKILSVCDKEQTNSLILRCKNGITRVEPTQLEYCEVIHRTLFIHLSNGNILETSGSLDELSKHIMPYGNFFRPHRSYLINFDYVKNLSYRAITMSCLAEIPVPRGRYNEIKDAFLAYAFQNSEVTT